MNIVLCRIKEIFEFLIDILPINQHTFNMKDVSHQLSSTLSISQDQSLISSIESGGGTTESPNASLAISDDEFNRDIIGVTCFMYK